MIDKERAYEILGLKDGASRANIENRYYVLLKKYKAGGEESLGGHTIDEVTQAYNVLTGKLFVVEDDFKPNPLLAKMGVDEKKVRNWLHYHKWHIIAVVVFLIASISLIKAILSPKPDFNMAIIGQIYYESNEEITQELNDTFEEINVASLDGVMTFNNDMAYELEMKIQILVGAAEVDLYIVDKEQFVRFGRIGLFEDLEPMAEELGINVEENEDYFIKAEEDEREHLYGVNVTESAFLKEFGVVGKEMIAGIRVNAKYPEKAKKVLKMLLEE